MSVTSTRVLLQRIYKAPATGSPQSSGNVPKEDQVRKTSLRSSWCLPCARHKHKS